MVLYTEFPLQTTDDFFGDYVKTKEVYSFEYLW